MLWHSRVQISYVVVHGRILAKIMKVKIDEVWVPTILLPLDQNECLVPHLKDLIHICLEPEAQRRGMTFKAIFLGSKYPGIIS